MLEMNKVMMAGNLTRDPELRSTSNGHSVCDFSIAVNRRYVVNNEKREEVCFVDVQIWGASAEACANYLKKGSAVFVEGRLTLDQWEDKETKKPRSKHFITAEKVSFMDQKPAEDKNYKQAIPQVEITG